MAEMNLQPRKRKKGLAPVLKKKIPRVDLTPMVDLGFLLITFFMFATTLTEPKALKLTMPNDKNIDTFIPVASEKGLILLLDKKNMVYSYEATAPLSSFRVSTLEDAAGFRALLTDKKKRTAAAIPSDPRVVISVKTTDEASYGNFISVLDEIKITDAGIPIVDKINDTEKQMMEKINTL
jgi:biopolymer transport protein ExbD